MVVGSGNECDNTISGRNQFVFLVLVHLLLIGLNGTNAQNRAPRIRDHPATLIIGKNDAATFRCVVEGKPKPKITWYKDGSILNPAYGGHIVFLEDELLFLKVNRGKNNDEGVYWCVARNVVGEAVSRNASLYIAYMRDDFKAEPRDMRVEAGQPVVIECQPPRGIPEPTVIWSKDDLPYGVELSSRIVLEKNTNLKILETLPSDTGSYRCIATNIAGERHSRAGMLTVVRRPHFIVKPFNTTAFIGETVDYTCQTYDEKHKITWVKDGGSLPSNAIILKRGLLRLRNVTNDDNGVYSCQAESAIGSSIASATLAVYALPYFTQIPTNLTTWENDVVSIPCAAKGLPAPTIFWILEGIQDSLLFPECTKTDSSVLYLDGAKIEHSGKIICVAVNAGGSVMQEAYLKILKRQENDLEETLDHHLKVGQEAHMTEYELIHARQYLQQNVSVLKRIETLSSTSLKIVWEVLTDYNEYLEGVKIWYNGTSMNWRNITEADMGIITTSNSDAVLCSNGSLIVVDNGGSSSYVLSGLISYMQYDIFIIPFYKTLLGKPSNLMTGYTDEDVPSAPPQDLTVYLANGTTALIHWERPPASTWNGIIVGFLVEIRVGIRGRVVGELSLSNKTQSAIVSSLKPGAKYSVIAAAMTRKGKGPFTEPTTIYVETQPENIPTKPPDDKKQHVAYPETWLIVLCVIMLLIIILGLLGIYYYFKRRNSTQKKKSDSQSIVTAQQCLLNKDTIWLRERPMFSTPNNLDIVSCHQSLLHVGQSTTVLSVEPEYSLPQNSIQELDTSSMGRLRNRPPEPYASSAIYTELNFKDNNEMGDPRSCSGKRSHNNSIVRSCNGSIQYSNGECSTCGHSTSSRSTKDYRDPRTEMQEISPDEDCMSCCTNRSGSRSRQEKSKVCPTEMEYDYPQWHWLGRDNSFKIPIQTSRHSNAARSEQGCQINLCDILPPPPYESPENKINKINAM